MKTEEILDEANLLNVEIKDIKRFISALDIGELKRENSNVTSKIKKVVETKTTWWVFGRRFFGCGAHEATINVPTSTIQSLVFLAKELLKTKELELQNLFTP